MKSGKRMIFSAAGGSVAALLTLLCATVVLAQAPSTSQGPAPAPGGRVFNADPRAEQRTYHLDGANIDVPYCLYKSSKVPKNKPAPLIVSLHGMGAPPAIMCNKTAIDLAEEGGYILAAPMGYSTTGWYGSPVIHMGTGRGPRGPGAAPPAPPAAVPDAGAAVAPVPSDADIEKWSENDVMNVLALMRKEFKVDNKRIYLTGHSMGGAGTYFLAAKHADIWAAVAPVAPASFMMTPTRADILKKIKDGGVPIMVVQGDADTVVPVDNARTWVATMKDLGMNYEYVEMPGIDHGPVITASQKDIYAFFAKHSKK
ncbi:MAG: prolyl oligopeptidase family serine peptidase [Pseudomonadota bacterium]